MNDKCAFRGPPERRPPARRPLVEDLRTAPHADDAVGSIVGNAMAARRVRTFGWLASWLACAAVPEAGAPMCPVGDSKPLQFEGSHPNLGRMTKPLALVLYEQLLPGTQLINRLQDHGYRVVSTSVPRDLLEIARDERPLFVLADLRFVSVNICDTLRQLKGDEATKHIAVVAFADPADTRSQTAALEAGAAVVASSDGILDQLDELLEQALHVE